MQINHIAGKEKHKIILYALSTCGWCKKTKELLKSLKVAYDFIDVDFLEGKDKVSVLAEIKKWNPRCSFPTIVIDNNICIAGFDEQKLKQELSK